MAASTNPNQGNNSNNFEPFLAVAVARYVSDEDHILSFRAGQEMLITGEVAREAGQFWWKGKIVSSEEDEKFIHKASVIKKIPYSDPSNEPQMDHEEDELKLQNLLRSVNLDVDKWTRIFRVEQIRSVKDLEAVLLEDGDNDDLAREMRSSERIKFRSIKASGEKKAKLREWISNAGLDTDTWFNIMAKHGVTSVADLVAVSQSNSAKIMKAARNSQEEGAVGRLLRLDLSGGAGGMTECLKGCGMRLRVEDLGEHNCLEMLRTSLESLSTRLNKLTEFVEPIAPLGRVTQLVPCYNEVYGIRNLLTDNTSHQMYHTIPCDSDYWLSRNGHTGPAFTYELPKAAYITSFSIRNTGNGHGTNGYKLLISTNDQDFMEVHRGNLPDLSSRFQSTPCVKVELEQAVLAKYVRFDVVSFYGPGPGLHFFKVHCDLSR